MANARIETAGRSQTPHASRRVNLPRFVYRYMAMLVVVANADAYAEWPPLSYEADRISTSWNQQLGDGMVNAHLDGLEGPVPAFRIPLGQVVQRVPTESGLRPVGHQTNAVPKAACCSSESCGPCSKERACESQVVPVAAAAKEDAENTAVETDDHLALPEKLPAARAAVPSLEEDLHPSVWPTVIYTTSTVTICVPDAGAAQGLTQPPVMQVLIRGVSNNVKDHECRADVRSKKAVFAGLESGAYEVLYLGADGTPTASGGNRRRLIVELEEKPIVHRVEKPLTAGATSSRENSAQVLPMTGQERRAVAHAMSLLERQATFSALRVLENVVVNRLPRHGRPVASGEANFADFFGGTGRVAAEVAAGERRADELAVELTRRLDQVPELSTALYSMAQAYHAIEQEKRPLMTHADARAEVCLRAAHLLNPGLVGPMRDLAIRLIDRRQYTEAVDCLHRAIETAPDAEAHFLLGQWLARENHMREAANAYREAITHDPYFLPASFELAVLELDTAAGALYGDDVRSLAIRLREFTHCDLLSATDRQWAKEQLARMSWLAREADQNLPSFTARRWIPRHIRWLPSERVDGIQAVSWTQHEAQAEKETRKQAAVPVQTIPRAKVVTEGRRPAFGRASTVNQTIPKAATAGRMARDAKTQQVSAQTATPPRREGFEPRSAAKIPTALPRSAQRQSSGR